MAAMQIQTADRMQRASIRDSMNLIRDVLTKVPVKVGGLLCRTAFWRQLEGC